MIRRDYILRMIEEFIRALARIGGLKKSGRWAEAAEAVDLEFKKLIDGGVDVVRRFSETELFARIIEGGATQTVREKTFMLTALLSDAGEIAAAQGRMEESRDCYLRALHLVLEALSRGDAEGQPDFVPKIEMLTLALRSAELPPRTYAMLMRHYERVGEFAKAEDALFALIETDPGNDSMQRLGVAFYERLLRESDHALTTGNLSRAEVREGLEQIQKWNSSP
jgi:hypothetical protein